MSLTADAPIHRLPSLIYLCDKGYPAHEERCHAAETYRVAD